jgi:hypothetical protein
LHLLCLPPEKTINRSWLRKPVLREEMNAFKGGLSSLFDRLRTDEGEGHLKNTPSTGSSTNSSTLINLLANVHLFKYK